MNDKLLDIPDKWQQEWIGMPEFIQEKTREYKSLIIRFNNEDDYNDFARLINQKLTKKTKSIWFPFKSHWGNNKEEEYYHVES